MMLLFESHALRDAVVDDAPLHHNGGTLTFEKSKESSNHFLVVPEWLVALECTDFPSEHWKLANIPAAIGKLDPVVEIDLECLLEDYSLHVVVERVRNKPVPPTLSVGNPSGSGLGAVFHVNVLFTWRRKE
ncbi:unnamed protein product [Urochloa humidicola]